MTALFRKYINRLKLLSCYPGIRRRRMTLQEYVDFVFHGGWRLFAPLQVKSEICRSLNLLEPRQPKRILEIGTASGGTLFLFARIGAPDAPLVEKGGVVIFHDIAPHDPADGCQIIRLWLELKNHYRHSEIIADPSQGWADIGVLYV